MKSKNEELQLKEEIIRTHKLLRQQSEVIIDSLKIYMRKHIFNVGEWYKHSEIKTSGHLQR